MRAERAHKACTVRLLGDLESKGECVVYDVACRSCCYAEISSDQPLRRCWSNGVYLLYCGSNDARMEGKRTLNTSSEAVAESETIMLANDYDVDLQDVLDMLQSFDVVDVELKNSSRSKPPLNPRIYPNKVIYIRPRLNSFRLYGRK